MVVWRVRCCEYLGWSILYNQCLCIPMLVRGYSVIMTTSMHGRAPIMCKGSTVYILPQTSKFSRRAVGCDVYDRI